MSPASSHVGRPTRALRRRGRSSTRGRIDALTYCFVAYQSDLATPTEIDIQVVEAVTALAANGSGAPDSTDAWTACLRESLDLHNAVRKQPVFRLAVDLDAGYVRVSG